MSEQVAAVPYRTIQRKRDGQELEPAELEGFFQAYAAGTVTDYQMSALLMAIFFRGLSPTELRSLVDVMLHSGAVVDLSAVPGRKVDKHSTGGVGDKVSLPLAPLVSSLGVAVPMISGRGLGHTGGTLDKLETIPGFRTNLSLEEFRDQVARIGCALIGQTAEIAPLDKRLYALRDVTGTVESIPLIASSIMSKKLAEGIDGLVLDIKRGSGAFLPDVELALELARTMVGIGERHGCEVVALLTAMDRPLGYAIGNALEVEESILVLQGEWPADLRELTLRLFRASVEAPPYPPPAVEFFPEARSLQSAAAVGSGFYAPELMGPVPLPAVWLEPHASFTFPGGAGMVGVELLAPRPTPAQVQVRLGRLATSLTVGDRPVHQAVGGSSAAGSPRMTGT